MLPMNRMARVTWHGGKETSLEISTLHLPFRFRHIIYSFLRSLYLQFKCSVTTACTILLWTSCLSTCGMVIMRAQKLSLILLKIGWRVQFNSMFTPMKTGSWHLRVVQIISDRIYSGQEKISLQVKSLNCCNAFLFFMPSRDDASVLLSNKTLATKKFEKFNLQDNPTV